MQNRKEEQAEYLYHHPIYRYNCAQAIIHKWTGDLEAVKNMSKLGSGRAPRGHCGALYAALTLAKTRMEHNIILLQFEAKAGSSMCREIRKLNQVSCRECVKIADNLLENRNKKNQSY